MKFEINKKILEKRLEELEESIKRVLANYNSLEGGRYECLHWIDVLNIEEKKAEEEKNKASSSTQGLVTLNCST